MAVVEVPEVKVEKIGLKPFHEFDAANETRPRGDRPAAIREAAAEFRGRFATPENRVRAVRTVDIASAGYPLKFAFGGAAKGANPYINIINRLQVVQFEDFDGELRTLAYEPTVPEGPAEAPYYAQQIEKLGEFLSYKVLATVWNHPDEALPTAAGGRGTAEFSAGDDRPNSNEHVDANAQSPSRGQVVAPANLGMGHPRILDARATTGPAGWKRRPEHVKHFVDGGLNPRTV